MVLALNVFFVVPKIGIIPQHDTYEKQPCFHFYRKVPLCQLTCQQSVLDRHEFIYCHARHHCRWMASKFRPLLGACGISILFISAMIMLKVGCLLLKRAHRVFIYYIDRALSLFGTTPNSVWRSKNSQKCTYFQTLLIISTVYKFGFQFTPVSVSSPPINRISYWTSCLPSLADTLSILCTSHFLGLIILLAFLTILTQHPSLAFNLYSVYISYLSIAGVRVEVLYEENISSEKKYITNVSGKHA